MPFLQKEKANCPTCGEELEFEVWTFIDVGQEPELRERLLRGEINVTCCPSCGEQTLLLMPLIYNDPAEEMLAFLIPHQLGLTERAWHAMVESMENTIQALLESDEEYLLRPYIVSDLMELGKLITEPAARAAFSAQTVLKRTTAAGQRAAEKILQSMLKDPVLAAIDALMEVKSQADVPRLVCKHPVLLSDEADETLQRGAKNARALGREELACAIEQRLNTLRQLRCLNLSLAELAELGEKLSSLSPEARAVLKELAGKEISSPEELELALKEHPGLMEKLEAALGITAKADRA